VSGEVLGYVVVLRRGRETWVAPEAAPVSLDDAVRDACGWVTAETVEPVVAEIRAVVTAAEIRAGMRKAADELTALTEELGLYEGGAR
jgi:hypothetical protein